MTETCHYHFFSEKKEQVSSMIHDTNYLHHTRCTFFKLDTQDVLYPKFEEYIDSRKRLQWEIPKFSIEFQTPQHKM